MDGHSPAQLLHNRMFKSKLPTVQSLLKPKVVPQMTKQIMVRQEKQKYYHDKNVKQLPELKDNQTVRYKSLDGEWKCGKIISICLEAIYWKTNKTAEYSGEIDAIYFQYQSLVMCPWCLLMCLNRLRLHHIEPPVYQRHQDTQHNPNLSVIRMNSQHQTGSPLNSVC